MLGLGQAGLRRIRGPAAPRRGAAPGPALGARRLRRALDDTDRAAARAARQAGALYPMLAAAGMARQAAHRRYMRS